MHFMTESFFTVLIIGLLLMGVDNRAGERAKKQYSLDSLRYIEAKKQTLLTDSLLSYSKSIYNDVRVVE